MKLFRYTLTLFSAFLPGIPLTVIAQNVPNGSVRQAAVAEPVPAPYPNITVSYVRQWEPDMPLSTVTDVTSASRKVREVKQSTMYYDGLGRLQETVAKGISYMGRDIVVPVIYDMFDREVYKYMSYVPKSGNINDGKFKTDPFNSQKAFYEDTVLNPGMSGEKIFYRKRDFEMSDMGRVLKTYSPGNSWNGHPTECKYLLNTPADSVRIWNLGSGIPVSTGIYSPGTLYKNVLIDEDGNQIIIYKDKENREILKKSQINTTTTAHVGWFCTYYVYDNVGKLCFVMPPLATQYAMQNNWSVNAVAKELCFSKQFDERGRLIIDQDPGTGRVFNVYDVRDRLVFTQDSVQRKKIPMEWSVTLYDARNRPTMKGIYKKTATREALQASMNSAPASSQLSYQFPLPADLALYKDESSNLYTAANSITFMEDFESLPNADFVAEIDADGLGETASVTATNPLPGLSADSLTPLIYLYYDNYNYPGKMNFYASDLTKPQAADTLYPQPLPATFSLLTNNIQTGMRVRVLDTDKWMTTTTYYDDRGRQIQTVSDNNVGGKDVQTNLYSFNGKLLSSYLRHQNPKSPLPEMTMFATMAYDHGGRLVGIKARVNDNPLFERVLASYTYDELGQLNKRRLGVTQAGQAIDSLAYTYNIRGWVNGINRKFVNESNNVSNWFGEEIAYDYGFSKNYYNGSVAGQKWKSRSDGVPRAYGYGYDKTNRIASADFFQRNTSTAGWTRDKMDFSVGTLTYDPNGNILTMKQQGVNGTAIEAMDNLSYSYFDNTNRLKAVTDANQRTSPVLKDFINGTNSGDDYAYDGNGNMTMDLNKGMATVKYNYLDLPALISITGKGSIAFEYDALGNKLKKTVIDNSSGTAKTTVTDYAGSFVYQQDSLVQIEHEEGRIRPLYITGKPLTFAFDYFEKDHLGSIRMVLTDQPDSSQYAATMETATAAKEVSLFSNVEETRAEKPAGYPDNQQSIANNFVAKLNGKTGGRKLGPGLVLRVMAGDTVLIKADAFYKTETPEKNNSILPVEDMIADAVQALASGGTSTASHDITTAGDRSITAGVNNSDFQRLKSPESEKPGTGRPKAYLNFAVFDNQFNLVESNSGVRQVKATPDEIQKLAVDKMTIEKSGFLYVYADNETPQDVYFDDMSVMLINGPVLEETHYYPFGLTMEAISNNVLKGRNYYENKAKFNGIEANNDLGLNQYDAFFRTFDPQLGRWWQPDPRPVEGISLYAAMYNNPALISDRLGDTGRIGTLTLPTVTVRGREYKTADLVNNLIAEWSRITGLKLSVKDGLLVNGGIRTNVGVSMTARKEILDMIKSEGNIYVDFSSLSTQRLQMGDTEKEAFIVVNPSEIEAFVSGSSGDLDPMTFGTGMVVLHELGHTFLHKNYPHSNAVTKFGKIDEPDERSNKIRRELGANWGQRLSYTSLTIGTHRYMPMTNNTLQMLHTARTHKLRAARMFSEMMRAKEMTFPLPTKGVIVTPL